MASEITCTIWEHRDADIQLERKGKRVEDKDLRDSKCNIGEMKNILVRKFYNHSHKVDLYSVQKSQKQKK